MKRQTRLEDLVDRAKGIGFRSGAGVRVEEYGDELTAFAVSGVQRGPVAHTFFNFIGHCVNQESNFLFSAS